MIIKKKNKINNPNDPGIQDMIIKKDVVGYIVVMHNISKL